MLNFTKSIHDNEKTIVLTPKNHWNPHHEAGEIIMYDGRRAFIPSGEMVYLSESDLLDIICEMRS